MRKTKMADDEQTYIQEYYPDGEHLKRRIVFNFRENFGYDEKYDVYLNPVSKKVIFDIGETE